MRHVKDRGRHTIPAGWDADSLRDPHGQANKAARVQAMFDAIAPAYERFNTVATLGRDAAWRRKAVAAVGVCAGDVVLDVCCGTGDMLRALARAAPTARLLIGVDFAANMLAHAEKRGQGPFSVLVRADAQRLPLADHSVSLITCAFGVRNFRDLQAGLDEMYRVARPGARVVILEFAMPESAFWRWAYGLYCSHVLPWIGAWVSHDRRGAYRYLPRSIRTFEPGAALAARLEKAGFRAVECWPMNFGGVILYRGVRPAGG
jgi:demethylmenaquinone methyltransferase/2-methoxy-6-polyprenyl-1,4-benzoquinol methylase